jgi:hypothetical protein
MWAACPDDSDAFGTQEFISLRRMQNKNWSTERQMMRHTGIISTWVPLKSVYLCFCKPGCPSSGVPSPQASHVSTRQVCLESSVLTENVLMPQMQRAARPAAALGIQMQAHMILFTGHEEPPLSSACWWLTLSEWPCTWLLAHGLLGRQGQ